LEDYTQEIKQDALFYTRHWQHAHGIRLPRTGRNNHSRVRFSSPAGSPSLREVQCVNSDCTGGSSDIVIHVSDGCHVCTMCGAIQSDQLIQELEPFLWGCAAVAYEDDRIRAGPGTLGAWTGSDYQPKFHWNEDDKLRRMVGPDINDFNKGLIFEKVQQMGWTWGQPVVDPKWVFQSSCRAIDKENNINLYGRKFGENWISLVAEFTQGKQKPPIPSTEEQLFINAKFDNFLYAWPMCCHLLPGSIRGRNRKQLPQYRWLYRMFQMTFMPERFREQWLEWLPILSVKKEKELKLFWKRVCFVLGWRFVSLGSFIQYKKRRNKKLIKHHQNKNKQVS